MHKGKLSLIGTGITGDNTGPACYRLNVCLCKQFVAHN